MNFDFEGRVAYSSENDSTMRYTVFASGDLFYPMGNEIFVWPICSEPEHIFFLVPII